MQYPAAAVAGTASDACDTLQSNLSHASVGLGMQLLLFGPESLKNNSAPKPQAELLPKVSVTDDIFELRRAFEEAERMGKKQADHEGSSMD